MPVSRTLSQKNQPPIKSPSNLIEWQRLMHQAIERAEMLGDRRAAGLRKALAEGDAEGHLRMLGIIHPSDILREFPAKAT